MTYKHGGHHWHFPSSSLWRTRITPHPQREPGVNLDAAAYALELLERFEELGVRLRALSR